MNVAIFYDSTEYQSLTAAAIAKTKYRDETLTVIDIKGKNEGAMTTAINTITDHTQSIVINCCITTASYAAAGHPSIDVNMPIMTGKIVSDAVSPYNAVIDLGNATGSGTTLKNPALLAWLFCYPTVAYPPIVKYTGGKTFHVIPTATATSAASGSLTHTGNFVVSAHIGQYVYIVSATTGAGQVAQIASNTANVLTLVSNWALTPTGTVVYGIVDYMEDALCAEALALVIQSKLWNIANGNTMYMWYKLLDLGAFDSSYNSINSGNLVGTYIDTRFMEALIEAGKNIYEYSVAPCYGPVGVKLLAEKKV